MSIGKNAMKRVENNGYSHVVTSAPDMENSVIAPAPAEKKPSGKGAARQKTAREGFFRVQIGGELPVWLL